jgi:hypothetical protein
MSKTQNIFSKTIELFETLWSNHAKKVKKSQDRAQRQPLYLLVVAVIGAWVLGLYYKAFFNDIWPEYWRVISSKSLADWGLIEVTVTFFVLFIKIVSIYYPAEKTFFLADTLAKISNRFNPYGLKKSFSRA